MKPIVSFDLDMTLLNHKTWEIPASAIKAIEKLRETRTIVLASGRDMDSSFSAPYQDIVKPDAIIHQNGTKITVGDKLIFEHCFDMELLKELLAFCEEKGYCVGAHMDDFDYFTHPSILTKHDFSMFGTSERRYASPWELLNMRIRTLSMFGDEEQALDIEAHFPALTLPMFAGKIGADVVERTADKGTGLVRLCDYLGTDIRDAVAFGDSMNDYAILKAAGIGVAMGNCIEELKTAADYVTDDIDKDGVYNACVHLGLI